MPLTAVSPFNAPFEAIFRKRDPLWSVQTHQTLALNTVSVPSLRLSTEKNSRHAEIVSSERTIMSRSSVAPQRVVFPREFAAGSSDEMWRFLISEHTSHGHSARVGAL